MKIVMMLLGAVLAIADGSRAAELRILRLRCEYLDNPRGIDATTPRLGWVCESGSRGQRQTAWQILVASSPEALAAGKGDLWDSGRVPGTACAQIEYAGQPLTSRMACHWKVRVWDRENNPSEWSAPATWTMGLLKPDDWQGRWIGIPYPPPAPPPPTGMEGTRWIWSPEQGMNGANAALGERAVRKIVVLPGGRKVRKAVARFSADNIMEFCINGHTAGRGTDFKTLHDFDVTSQLAATNVICVVARNVGDGPNPAGVVGRLTVEFDQGEPLSVPTDASWEATAARPADTGATGGEGWQPARVVADYGAQPWGKLELAITDDRRLPARWFRREFAAQGPVRRATAYVCGLGYHEFHVNGKKVGTAVLEPAVSDYSQRVFYVTHDITALLGPGTNACGIVLGNGRFHAPRLRHATTYGAPRALAQIDLEYADGRTERIVSDPSWRATDAGPIRANNDYDGEDFDAQLEMHGWSEPGFKDDAWIPAPVMDAPAGALRAEMIPPMRVTETLEPKSITKTPSGTWIVDFGQNMVGWCRIKVEGPRGTAVSLHHAETLGPDGGLYVANLRTARTTDTYTLRGGGLETWEPRFTYHGFRYVEVSGWPGELKPGSIAGMVVHNDLQPAGRFECSNPTINAIERNIRWGARGNYLGVPTDCPQRDERQGWLGDRAAESKGETYLFDIAPLYSKWMDDMKDSQRPDGHVSDVCPAFWPFYSANVTWPSAYMIVPGTLRTHYGDERAGQAHYENLCRWMAFFESRITNGLLSADQYGDWCVPPEKPQLIHSEDPARRTSKTVLATTYYIHNLHLLADMGARMGRTNDATRFRARAAEMQDAFNAMLFDAGSGRYDNGTQTAAVLPLAFDLVPATNRPAVFSALVTNIEHVTDRHIGTGLIGGQWLMRALTDGGRPDLAYTLATNRTYPSWGYMVDQGATTIWELWNGNTADPAMNSGNHMMLVGDLNIWLFESLAGIAPDPAAPGFERIIMKPRPLGDLTWVTASHDTIRGRVCSEWRIENSVFRWSITVPVNSTAVAWVPARQASQVTEGGRTAAQSVGVKFITMDGDRAVFELASGRYEFASPFAR